MKVSRRRKTCKKRKRNNITNLLRPSGAERSRGDERMLFPLHYLAQKAGTIPRFLPMDPGSIPPQGRISRGRPRRTSVSRGRYRGVASAKLGHARCALAKIQPPSACRDRPSNDYIIRSRHGTSPENPSTQVRSVYSGVRRLC